MSYQSTPLKCFIVSFNFNENLLPSLQMDFCACDIMSIRCHMILYNISSAIQQVNIKLNCLVCVCHCWFLFSLDIITLYICLPCCWGCYTFPNESFLFTDNQNNWELMLKILIYYPHFLLLCSLTWWLIGVIFKYIMLWKCSWIDSFDWILLFEILRISIG